METKYLIEIMKYKSYELFIAKDSNGRNILHKLMDMNIARHTWDIEKEFIGLTKTVLESPQELYRQKDHKGDTPVHVLMKNSYDLERLVFLTSLLELFKEAVPWSLQNNEEVPWLIQNELGNTPLHEAIIANNITLVEELLELYHQHTNDLPVWLVQNVEGNTPLHLAIIVNSTSVRRLLELYNSNVSKSALWLLMKNVQGNTPVHEALIAKNTTLARELFEKDLNVAKINNECGELPLHLIAKCLIDCKNLDDESLKSLIETYKIATTWPDKEGHTIWHKFVLNYEPCLIRRLTKIYTNASDFKKLIKIKNKDGKTPLHLAIDQKKLEHARMLIELFPDVLKEPDKEGKTPLHHLLSDNYRYVELIEQCRLVLENNKQMVEALVMLQDRDENTLLHLAIKGRHFSLVYDLLRLDEKEMVIKILDTKNKYGTKPSDLIGDITDLPPKLDEIFISEPKFRGIRSVYGITKPQMINYVNSMGVIAALLATITFTTAFTVPGGLLQDKGTPIFIKEASFSVFMVFNVLTMCLSIMVLFCLLWIMAANDQRKSVMLLDFSMSLLRISFYTILVAFMTGVYATIEPVKLWMVIYTLVLCSLIMLIMRKNHMVEWLGPLGTKASIVVAKYFPDAVQISRFFKLHCNKCCERMHKICDYLHGPRIVLASDNNV